MRIQLLFHTYLMFTFSLCTAASVQEISNDQLAVVIKQKQSTPESRNQAIAAGRERALLCSVCHGKDGNSMKPDIPNLAGQNPVYLLDQIKKFADGRRKNYVMNSLAKGFSSDDKINLAIFYNSMPVKPHKIDKQLAVSGEQIYEKRCISCHGERGAGSTSFARIAGQQPQYVIKTLKQFRDNANARKENSSTNRSSYVMESIVKQYTDNELETLAAYIAQLP